MALGAVILGELKRTFRLRARTGRSTYALVSALLLGLIVAISAFALGRSEAVPDDRTTALAQPERAFDLKPVQDAAQRLGAALGTAGSAGVALLALPWATATLRRLNDVGFRLWQGVVLLAAAVLFLAATLTGAGEYYEFVLTAGLFDALTSEEADLGAQILVTVAFCWAFFVTLLVDVVVMTLADVLASLLFLCCAAVLLFALARPSQPAPNTYGPNPHEVTT